MDEVRNHSAAVTTKIVKCIQYVQLVGPFTTGRVIFKSKAVDVRVLVCVWYQPYFTYKRTTKI